MRLEREFFVSVSGLVYIQTFLLFSTLFFVLWIYVYFNLLRGGKEDTDKETEEDSKNKSSIRFEETVSSVERVMKEDKEDIECGEVEIETSEEEEGEKDVEEVGDNIIKEEEVKNESSEEEEEIQKSEYEEEEIFPLGKVEDSDDDSEEVEIKVEKEDRSQEESFNKIQVNQVLIKYDVGVIIDVGEETTRCGSSGDEIPKEFATLVGWHKHDGRINGFSPFMSQSNDDVFVGDHWQKRSFLDIRSPFENGFVKNWLDMEKIYGHVYKEKLYGKEPEDHPVLITEPPLNPKNNREKVTSLMFETFSIPAIYLANKCVMALYSTNRTTGMVVDVGLNHTFTVPVFEGYSIKHATCHLPLGGDQISETLIRVLQKDNDIFYDWNWCKYQDKKTVNDIKKRCCYFSTGEDNINTNEEETREPKKKNYTLPDGNVVGMGSVLHGAPEILFYPSSIGGYHGVHLKELGVHEMVLRSILKTDPDLRERMYQNIVLSGGTTMMEGFDQRLVREIGSKNRHLVRIVNPSTRSFDGANRSLRSFVGASLITSLSSFNKMWIDKQEYEEFGATIVHRKCLC